MIAQTETTPLTWQGIDNLLDLYIALESGNHLAVVYSMECREVAAWISVAARQRDIDLTMIGMAAIDDTTLPQRLAEKLPPPGEITTRLVVLTVERDSMSHFATFRDLRDRYTGARCSIVRIISGSEQLFSKTLAIEPEVLSNYNATLLRKMRSVDKARIRTDSGTDLVVEFDHDHYMWTSNRGMNKSGGFLILPPGEVATMPARINGTLVADAAFNVNVFTRLDARLTDHPVRVRIDDGRATDFDCASADVSRLIELCWSIPHARRVGELGFGTNTAVDTLVPMNSHINERIPGVHIGFGQHNQSISRVDYICDVHLDLIARGGIVELDGADEVIDLAHPVADGSAHPEGVNDEDIDGDCCIMTVDQCLVLGR